MLLQLAHSKRVLSAASAFAWYFSCRNSIRCAALWNSSPTRKGNWKKK